MTIGWSGLTCWRLTCPPSRLTGSSKCSIPSPRSICRREGSSALRKDKYRRKFRVHPAVLLAKFQVHGPELLPLVKYLFVIRTEFGQSLARKVDKQAKTQKLM
jgi:hypothetical protein